MKRVLLIIALMAAGCGNSATPGKGFLLTFAPPDSINYHAEVLSVRARVIGTDTVAVDTSWSTTTHDMEKTPEGYVVHSRTDSMWVKRDGKIINDPIVNLFSTGKFTHLINPDGQVRDIQGYDELFQKLDTILGPETAAGVRKNINPANLRERDMEEWNNRMGRYAGHEMFLNNPHYDTTAIQVPTGGSLTAFEVSELQDTVRIDTALCAVIRVSMHTDPRQLANLVGSSPSDMVKTFKVSDSTLNALDQGMVSAMMQSTWVVAINTMLSHSYVQKRVIQLKSGMAGPNSQPAAMVELQSKKYTY